MKVRQLVVGMERAAGVAAAESRSSLKAGMSESAKVAPPCE